MFSSSTFSTWFKNVLITGVWEIWVHNITRFHLLLRLTHQWLTNGYNNEIITVSVSVWHSHSHIFLQSSELPVIICYMHVRLITHCVCVCVCVPDDLDQLAHVDMVWYQELGLVQNRQLLLSLIPLNDHLQQPRHTTKWNKLFNWCICIFIPTEQLWCCDTLLSAYFYFICILLKRCLYC